MSDVLSDQDILKLYLPLVDFLGAVLGPATEVVLNDCSNPARSVIAIRNSLSGRTVGSPITDYGMNVLRNGEYKDKDHDLHYKGKANGKDFVSSSFFIKNLSGDMIGMLCLNKDISLAENLIDATNRLLGSLNYGLQVTNGREQLPAMENLDTSLTTLIVPLISRTIEKYGVDPDRFTQEERLCIVQELAQQGVSAVKGGVAEIAAQLHISESTVYRYLKKKEN